MLNLEVALLWYLVCFHIKVSPTCLNTQVNATIHKNLLKSHVLPALNCSEVKGPIFVQDNAPSHKAKSVLNFLKEKKVQLLDWPAQSPDLNPIENFRKSWATSYGKKSNQH